MIHFIDLFLSDTLPNLLKTIFITLRQTNLVTSFLDLVYGMTYKRDSLSCSFFCHAQSITKLCNFHGLFFCHLDRFSVCSPPPPHPGWLNSDMNVINNSNLGFYLKMFVFLPLIRLCGIIHRQNIFSCDIGQPAVSCEKSKSKPCRSCRHGIFFQHKLLNN